MLLVKKNKKIQILPIENNKYLVIGNHKYIHDSPDLVMVMAYLFRRNYKQRG